MLDISLVILTCNQRDYTLRCLDSLSAFFDEPRCEVILVDNGSTDGTAESVQKEYPNVRVIRLDSNKGVAAGRNIGLKVAQGRHLMILDNDTIADADTIKSLSAYLDANSDVGLVAPKLLSISGDVQTSFRPYPGIKAKVINIIKGKSRSSIAIDIPDRPIEPFYVLGAAQMFTREVYESSRGLDENIFYGPEDADFCMAVRACGKRVVYLPYLSIIHDWQRATTGNLLSPAARVHIRALIYFYRKHHRWF